MSEGAYIGFGMFGWKELDVALQALEDIGTQKRILISAMKKALKPALVAAKQKVPVDSGDLRDSIVISTTITRRQGRGSKTGTPKVYLGSSYPSAHLIEFGTGTRVVTTDSKKVLASRGKTYGTSANVGSVSAQPFIRPAFEQNRGVILNLFGKEMWKNLERVARRLHKQALANKLSASGRRALGIAA